MAWESNETIRYGITDNETWITENPREEISSSTGPFRPCNASVLDTILSLNME